MANIEQAASAPLEEESMPENSPKSSSFWDEVKRRKVVRVVVAYLLVGWGLIQIADATIDPLRLPEWADTLVVWLVALGLPIAVVLAWVLDVTPKGIEVTASAEADESSSKPADASIAVLPFVNMSGDEDNEYFSDGLSEELLNLLSRLHSLRVCSRTSSFSLKGKDIDMPTIAKQLGVRHVLEGSVRRSGNKVRITAQLIDACEDCHLWSATYDRELRDIFEVQDEIANNIVTSLKLTLTVAEKQAIHSTTDSVDALDCYLRGRDLYHRTDPGHLDRSREKFEEALRIDPRYALAWAGLTYVYVDTYWYREKEEKLLQNADEASSKAVELAPHLAESHAARGLALRVNEKFPEAEAEFEKAIELNPNLFEPIHFYAQMARSVGQYEKAATLFRRAADVRPEDFQALAIASNMHDILGNRPLSLDTCKEALDRVNRAVALNPTDSRALILGAGMMQQVGDDEAVFDWMTRADRAYPDSPSVAYNSACIYAKYGDAERALDYLEKAISLGSRNKRYFEHDPDFLSIKDHPRFKALLEKI